MKLLLSLLFINASYAHTLTNCIDSISNFAYKGVISETSNELSFLNCPKSILLNDRYVANLSQVLKDEDITKCVYKRNSVILICEKE